MKLSAHSGRAGALHRGHLPAEERQREINAGDRWVRQLELTKQEEAEHFERMRPLWEQTGHLIDAPGG